MARIRVEKRNQLRVRVGIGVEVGSDNRVRIWVWIRVGVRAGVGMRVNELEGLTRACILRCRAGLGDRVRKRLEFGKGSGNG